MYKFCLQSIACKILHLQLNEYLLKHNRASIHAFCGQEPPIVNFITIFIDNAIYFNRFVVSMTFIKMLRLFWVILLPGLEHDIM